METRQIGQECFRSSHDRKHPLFGKFSFAVMIISYVTSTHGKYVHKEAFLR